MSAVAPSPDAIDQQRSTRKAAGVEPGSSRGVEMWSSRELNLAWLPRCDNWHNPSLFSATLPEAVYVQNPLPKKSDQRPVWFWRVDMTFGAWVVRAIHRAGQAKADLPQVIFDLVPVLRNELESVHPGCWSEVERMAANPVKLPGSEILTDTVNHVRIGLCPLWEGWERIAEKLDLSSQQTPDQPPKAESRKRTTRKTDDGSAKLFN